MGDLKVITLKLDEETLGQIDKLGFANRSEALRHLIQTGMKMDALDQRLADIELTNQSLEQGLLLTYQTAYISAYTMLQNYEGIKADLKEIMAAAKAEYVKKTV